MPCRRFTSETIASAHSTTLCYCSATYYLKANGLENHIPEVHKGKSWVELEQVLNHETAELGSRLARGGSAAHYAIWQERNDIYDHEAWNEHIASKYHVAPADLLGIR